MIDGNPLDPAKLESLRQELGSNFGRVVGYFREDGAKSIGAIEDAVRVRSAIAVVRPAYTLKGDAHQFGAIALGTLAEQIEIAARQAIESGRFPAEMIAEAARLRPMFDWIMALLAHETSTASTIRRAVGLGRRMPAGLA